MFRQQMVEDKYVNQSVLLYVLELLPKNTCEMEETF